MSRLTKEALRGVWRGLHKAGHRPGTDFQKDSEIGVWLEVFEGVPASELERAAMAWSKQLRADYRQLPRDHVRLRGVLAHGLPWPHPGAIAALIPSRFRRAPPESDGFTWWAPTGFLNDPELWASWRRIQRGNAAHRAAGCFSAWSDVRPGAPLPACFDYAGLTVGGLSWPDPVGLDCSPSGFRDGAPLKACGMYCALRGGYQAWEFGPAVQRIAAEIGVKAPHFPPPELDPDDRPGTTPFIA